jgi:hypothetical protein
MPIESIFLYHDGDYLLKTRDLSTVFVSRHQSVLWQREESLSGITGVLMSNLPNEEDEKIKNNPYYLNL